MVWYYVKDGARQGPVDEAEFNKLVGQYVVRPETLVWSEGMSEWRPYSTVAPASPPAAVAPPAPAPEPRFESRSDAGGEARMDARMDATIEPRAEYRSEQASMMAVSAAPAESYSAPAASAAAAQFCSQCGKPYPSEELVRFGSATICANCKDIYAQRLRETGQVAGARVYGGFWIRFGAYLIDAFALWIVNFAIQSITGTRISNPNDLANLSRVMGTLGVNFLLSTCIWLFYEAFFLVQYGATPGKMICRLKVITPDGGPITWGRAIGRYFAKILSSVTLSIGFIMAGFDSEKRALHDYIAGTRVIRT